MIEGPRWKGTLLAGLITAVLLLALAPGAEKLPSASPPPGASVVGPVTVSHTPFSRHAGARAPPAILPTTLPTWSKDTNLTSAPSARGAASIAYDSELRAVVLFGGYAPGRYFNDTWEFANQTWVNVTTFVGKAPPGRDGGTLADDPVDGYLVLWGGASDVAALSDTWILNTTGWHDVTSQSPRTPAACYTCNSAWDAADQYVLLFDGYSTAPTPVTWKFSAGVWSKLNNTGSGSPGVTEAGGMDYDPNVRADVYYDDFPNTFGQDGTWEFSGGNWTNLGFVPTPTRAWPGMTFDGIDNYTLLFGGSKFSSSAPYELNDTWAFESGTWSNITGTSGAAPSARDSPGMVFDAHDGYVLLFGGEYYTGSTTLYLADTWTFGIYSPSNPPTPTVSLSANRTVTDAGLPIGFTALPGAYGAPPFAYSWSFGDGATATGLTSTHAFVVAGNFTVNVTITDAHRGTGSNSLVVRVHSAPIALWSDSRSIVDIGIPVSFTASVVGGIAPYGYSWSFGDGSTGTGPAVQHAYTAHGVDVVQLFVDDGMHLHARTAGSVTVEALPGVTLTDSAPITDIGLPVAFGTTVSNGSPPFVITWNFSDGSTATGTPSTHAFLRAGYYPVNLTVTDVDGSQAWAAVEEKVNPTLAPAGTVMALKPGASRGSSAMANVSTAFQFAVRLDGGTAPYAVTWNLDDGATSTSTEVNHTYSQPGNYSVSVSVTDALGESYHATLNVSVTAIPSTSNPRPSVPSPATGGSGILSGIIPYLLVGLVVLAAVVASIVWARRRGSPPGPGEAMEPSDAAPEVDPDDLDG
jgi:PKD repeat protein